MKIIKEGKRKTTERIDCPHCKSILEITKADVYSGSRLIHNLEHQYEYIICAVCGHIMEFSKSSKLFDYTIESEEEEKEEKTLYLTHCISFDDDTNQFRLEIRDDITNCILFSSLNPFSGDEYISALKYGLALGKQGYTDVMTKKVGMKEREVVNTLRADSKRGE